MYNSENGYNREKRPFGNGRVWEAIMQMSLRFFTLNLAF